MHEFGWRRFVVGLAVGLVALAAPRAGQAQTGKIAGTVTDAATGEPVAGVQIFVRGTTAGGLSQTNGRYFLVSVPPGTHTVEARRIGYQPAIVSNVDVRIDVTRELNFRLSTAAGQVAAVRIVAEQAPLVERGVTASRGAVQAEVIEALPVTSIAGVLALQQGFFQVPSGNTDIVSFSSTRQNTQSPIRIRGGRAGETLTLIDGIPINNYVFGGPAFDLNTTAIQQVDFQKGGFEAQYGNALSGIINLATREGGTAVAGNVEYQSSAFGAALGSRFDDLQDQGLFRGYISGPIPGTASRARFAISGQQTSGRAGVYEFDDDIASFSRRRDPSLRQIQTLDLFPGLRAFGYDRQRDALGKLTFYPSASGKLNLTAIVYDRQRQGFDFDYSLGGFNPLGAPGVRTLEDSIGVYGSRRFQDIVQGSIEARRQLYSANYSQRFGRSNLILRAARFDQQRSTCNYFQGVCQAGQFADLNFTESYAAPGGSIGFPNQGTDEFYGGEEVRTNVVRADLESQVTDHHALAGGVFWQRHDIQFAELRNQGTNGVFVVPGQYRSKPWEAAAYLQDKIEYDFLSVNLGVRFDYARATGLAFRNPLDPSNGTTIRQVCEGQAPGVGATSRVEAFGLQGYAACSALQGDTATATRDASRARFAELVAQGREDDFEEAAARASFNPRIGLAFPLTERSNLYFNFGRYAQNPVYNNLYQNTNVGTVAGEAGGICNATSIKPGTTECNPAVFQTGFRQAFLGNPNLRLEQTTSYEIGYSGEFRTNYALQLSVFNKDQTGLAGVAPSGATQDPAGVYGSTPSYSVIVNQDFQTVRGFEVQLRRRIADYWGFDVNYAYSRSTTNSPAPELAEQQRGANDPVQRIEVRSEIDQPHVFNAAVYLRAGNRAPAIRFGNLLRNSYFTATHSIRSGLPYTPILDFIQGTSDQALFYNSGRGPSTQQTDILMGKDFALSNLRYGTFVRISNVFNVENCFQVFPSTGNCDAGVVDQDRSQLGNAVSQSTATSTFLDRAHYKGANRSIFAGVKVSF